MKPTIGIMRRNMKVNASVVGYDLYKVELGKV